ncbi:MAG: hypothetical protein M1819_001389 [Sarea resinae]|nr:MAG: hypothetical protein M1819_001389 [Sarea resinae]
MPRFSHLKNRIGSPPPGPPPSSSSRDKSTAKSKPRPSPEEQPKDQNTKTGPHLPHLKDRHTSKEPRKGKGNNSNPRLPHLRKGIMTPPPGTPDGESPDKKKTSPAESTHEEPGEQQFDPQFSPDEEATLLSETSTHRLRANELFATSRFDEAIQVYDRALSSCPNYLEYQTAVLRSNISACHLKLLDWKSAIEAATKSLEALDRLEEVVAPPAKNKDDGVGPANGDKDEVEKSKETERVVEVTDESLAEEEAKSARISARLSKNKTTKEDVARIRAKALMRRAKARSEMAGWANLQGAEEDYKLLSSPSFTASLPAADRKIVRQALQTLPARLEDAKTKEMGEMMSKLKDLGNGFLKPFGLSTDNFNMVKDEKTGGYSMNFEQGTKRT